MKAMHLLLLVTGFAVLSGCSRSLESASQHKPLSTQDSRIFEGFEPPQESPISRATVKLFLRPNASGPITSSCTGIVLSPTVILTAGHCVTNAAVYPSRVAFMVYTEDRVTAKKILARKMVPHPNFLKFVDYQNTKDPSLTFFLGYDLAVIQLSQALSSWYQPVQIESQFDQIFKEQLFVAGFGASGPDEVSSAQVNPNHTLRAGQIKISNETTYRVESFPTPLNRPFARELTFKKAPEDSGVCHGDSGGPLYFESGGQVRLVAIDVSIQSVLLCANNGSFQNSTLMFGENLKFLNSVLKDFKTQTVQSSLWDSVDKDPNLLETQFLNESLPNKNVWLDMSGNRVALVLQAAADTASFLIVRVGPNEDPCKIENWDERAPLIVTLADRDRVESGRIHTYVQNLKKNGDGKFKPFSYIEAYVGLKTNKFDIVTVTPDGFLRAQVDLVKCQH